MKLLAAEMMRLRAARGLILAFLAFALLSGFSQYQGAQIAGDMAEAWDELADNPKAVAEHGRADEQESRAQHIRLARTAYGPTGMLVAVLSFFASALGVALGVVVGSWVFGADLPSRGLRYLLIRHPRRSHVAIAKAATGFAIVVAFAAAMLVVSLVATGLVVGALNVGAGDPYPIAAILRSSWVELAVVPLIVVLVGGSLAALFAIVTRSAWTGLLVTGGILFADFLVSRPLRAFTEWSLSYNIWSLGSGFRNALSRVNQAYFWVQDFPVDAASFARSAIYLLAVISVAILLLVYRLRTAEF